MIFIQFSYKLYFFLFICKYKFKSLIMKTNFVYLLLIGIFISSCSSTDDSSDGASATSLFPLTNGNYWTYDVDAQIDGRDSLYVKGDTLISSLTYKKMKTKQIASGFFSNSLRNNGVRINGSLVQLTGGLSFDLGLTTPLNFAVQDFVILKKNAVQNDVLSTVTGSFNQTIGDYPMTFDYTVKSISDGNVATFTSNGKTYNDIQKTKVVVSLKVSTTTTIPGTTFPLTVVVLNQQDVVTSTQYYANTIGMVYADTNITYQLNSLPNITLPIPESGNQNIKEYLDTYLAN